MTNPPPDVDREPPPRLQAGGLALWHALYQNGWPEHLVALLTEACRCRDRLDRFDDVLSGELDTWLYLLADRGEDEQELHINVTDVVVKANQTATSLKNLLDKLPTPAAAAAPSTTGGPKPPANPLDELTARRQANEQQGGTSGSGGDGLSTRARTAARRRPKQ